MKVLGISAYFHDSAAALLVDGKIVAAAQEERFTRKKHDENFPSNAINYCLAEAGIRASELDFVAFYDKPLLKFERLLETYLAYAPKGFSSFLKAIPVWIKQKLWVHDLIRKELGFEKEIIFTEHHQSHAASAFYPSPFKDAAVLTIDGVGEWATTSYGVGSGNKLNLLKEIHFPHSLGLLYSAFTYYTGFKVNSGEYKVMGLAPYGEPKYVKQIYDHLIDVKDDGSFQLNMDYFNYCAGLTMTSPKFHELFGGEPRKPESELKQRDMDLAASIQVVCEDVMLRMARHVRQTTNQVNLCMAGGVALNCVGNGKILAEKIFDNIWIQPASGDAGGALGAALTTWYDYLENPRTHLPNTDFMSGSLLGPSYSDDEVEEYLRSENIPYIRYTPEEAIKKTAEFLEAENVIGWFQGRMEFGPRALGARSILGDARSAKMQSVMNLKIKFRESFRPFAPIVLSSAAPKYFELEAESPYMLIVAPVRSDLRIAEPEESRGLFGIERLNLPRSTVPAITHVDYSARIQTVDEERNPRLHELLKEFERRTDHGILVNTSFNVRGEPIVCTPQDAIRCFLRTGMDYLVIGNIILDKTQQPKLENDTDWMSEFELD
jgi:carbamoyltransferase